MCAPEVRRLILKVDGVTAAEISFEEKTATVTVKEGTEPETVVAAVTGRFFASIKE